MLVWLVWERTEGVPAVRQLPNLPDQLPGGVIANTKQQAALPQTPEMASLGRKRGSLYLYNNKRCKAIRNIQAWTTSAREAGLAFEIRAPGLGRPACLPGGSRLGARGIFKVHGGPGPVNASTNNLSGNGYIDC